MTRICNIAAYRFVTLNDLPERQQAIRQSAVAEGLKGTVLLAEEGINLFLAGDQAGIDRFLDTLQEDPAFANLEVKRSYSDTQPFGRMLVKIKREIIRMDHPAIRPEAGRAPSVTAAVLQRWLAQGVDDSGRPVLMLDTRNAFEVQAGTFKGAVHWDLAKFTEFPAALQAHRESLQDKTVVSFCTGGIRCEKAAIHMAEQGLSNVFQLDGGILKYFEETDGRDFEGTCFVFDERQTLDRDLAPVSLKP